MTDALGADHHGRVGGSHGRFLFTTLMLGLLSQGLALTAITPALPEMARDLGERGQFIAQMAIGAAAMGVMVGAVISGWVLERSGTRVTMLTSSLLFAVAGSGGLCLHGAFALLASRVLVGFSAACIVTTCFWVISAEYSGRQRTRAFGFAGATSGLAGLLSTVLGGYLTQRGGWSLAFVQYPILGVVVLVLTAASMQQLKPRVATGSAEGQISYAGVLPIYLLVVILFSVVAMGGTQLPFLLQDEGVVDPTVRSVVLGIPTVTATACSFAYGALRHVLSVRATFTLALSCMVAGLVVIGWGEGPYYAGLGAALTGCCVGVMNPGLYHLVADRTDEHSRGRHLGWLNAVTFLGVSLNPIALAPVTAAIGARGAFLAAALVMAVLALLTAYGLLPPGEWRKTPTVV